MQYVSGSRGQAAQLTLMLWLALALVSSGCKLRLVGSTGEEDSARIETDVSAPTLSSIANQDVAPGTSTGPISITVADSDTEPEDLTVTASSDNQTLLPDSAIVVTGTGASRSISFTPSSGQTGTATVTVTVSDGVHATIETFVVTVTGMNLEVPIDITDLGAYTGAAPASAGVFEHTRTSFDTNDYDGTVTYFFDVVAENWTLAAGASVQLVDSAGNTRATIPLSTSNNGRIRYRGTFTPNAGADTYRLKLSQTSEVLLDAARIIVRQVGATKTKIYYPLYGEHDQASQELGQPSAANSTNSTTFAMLDILFHYNWLKDTTALATLDGANPWTFEAVMSVSDPSAIGTLALFRNTTVEVPTYQLTTTSGTPTLVSMPIPNAAPQFTDGAEFNVKAKSNNGAYSVSIYRAGIWVKLTTLTKAQVLYRYMRAGWAAATRVHYSQRTFLETTSFSSPGIYNECHGYEVAPTDDIVLELHTDGVNDSGTAAGTPIANSGIELDSATFVRRRSPALSLTSGDRYIFRALRNSGTWDIAGCFIVVNATR